MRIPALLVAVSTLSLGGCALVLEGAAVATYPMNKKGKFEDAQKRYTTDIRFGLWDEALGFVEPEHQQRFRREMDRMREIRFSDYHIEAIQLDAGRTQATAVVVFRGYWLSSPFEQEVRVTQRWRRAVPSQNWFVTPDFGSLLEPPLGG